MFNKKTVEIMNLKLELSREKEKVANRDKFIENQSEIIKSLKEDNAETRRASYNAEARATEYARKIKEIEDIMKSKDTLTNKNKKINEILFA